MPGIDRIFISANIYLKIVLQCNGKKAYVLGFRINITNTKSENLTKIIVSMYVFDIILVYNTEDTGHLIN